MAKILLAEDDNILRTMMIDSLEFQGHEVDGAEDGEEAWHLWRLGEYDILITDINMPKMNGIDLLKNIRELNKTFPIIVITGVYFESAEKQAIDFAANMIMYKPFSMKKLFEAVNKFLAQ